MTTKSLMERLNGGESVLCGQGYLFEMERRGYLQAGAFVPEVVLEHPEVVEQLHREFVRAGSDVVLAFTYYGHREKLRLIGKEDLLEPLNREALKIAHKVAKGTDCLVAGNICNTNIYDTNDTASHAEVRAIFEEQVGWAAEEGVDYILAETIGHIGEARIALDVCKKHNLPIVLTLATHRDGMMRDGPSAPEACKILSGEGAEVVGFNCIRGPATMLPLLEKAVEICPKGTHLAGVPVPYRTTDAHPTFQSIEDHDICCPEKIPVGSSFPTALDPFICTRYEMADFTEKCVEMGVNYIGVCCGAGPHHVRSMAEALGRKPEASRYSPDMSKHFALGDDALLKDYNTNVKDKL
jgi:betaine-homocysteine S-methyltransferase